MPGSDRASKIADQVGNDGERQVGNDEEGRERNGRGLSWFPGGLRFRC